MRCAVGAGFMLVAARLAAHQETLAARSSVECRSATRRLTAARSDVGQGVDRCFLPPLATLFRDAHAAMPACQPSSLYRAFLVFS
jgi:hypothetical protein